MFSAALFLGNESLFTTPNITKNVEIQPKVICIHYTASSNFNNTVAFCCDPKNKVSYHAIIGRDGELATLARDTARTWHAGKSEWFGGNDVNSFSYGIGLVNRGWISGDTYVPVDNEHEFIRLTHPAEHISRRWQRYTAPQLIRLLQVCWIIYKTHPITWIVGHEDVSPGRKVDPGPAFGTLPLCLPPYKMGATTWTGFSTALMECFQIGPNVHED